VEAGKETGRRREREGTVLVAMVTRRKRDHSGIDEITEAEYF
jgi:hypothetical protein